MQAILLMVSRVAVELLVVMASLLGALLGAYGPFTPTIMAGLVRHLSARGITRTAFLESPPVMAWVRVVREETE
jgi:hypothetical protein